MNNVERSAKNGNGDSAPKKFLFVSFEALSGDLAWKVQDEGHKVKCWIQDPDDGDVYDGFLEKVEDWKRHVDWADVVVFDDTGFGEEADRLRKAGKLVVGGSSYTDRLENDREFGSEEMKKAGITILPHSNFDNFSEAIEFLKKNPGRYVFKPSGNIHSEDKGLLFVGQDEEGKDLLEVLESNAKAWSRKIKVFQLQKFAAGVEIAVGAFFNGKEFITPVNINFEHKKLFPGEIGPSTGEMGTAMYWSEPNTIFRETLAKLQPALAASGYAGYIDINCIANAKGVYPLEITARFGYPTISIQMEGVTSPMGELLHALASGQGYQLRTKRGFQIGVVVAAPPFPFDDKKEWAIYKDSSIVFKKGVEGMHLGDVKLVEGVWKLAGSSGYVLVVTGSGSTMEEARAQAYSRLKTIVLQNMFYRTDIGLRWNRDSDRLQTWGYLF
ncbi:MAG TPA: phosphoribosylglycinamide synthetase C domain-containing protein [archaeon]|nr:phosphoribosylglycinamide synthetase C domain-containing protein [archaeon]